MKVTVSYQETHVMRHTIDVDPDEVLAWYNEDQTVPMTEVDNSMIHVFLEEACDQSIWTSDHAERNVFAESYDQEIVAVEIP